MIRIAVESATTKIDKYIGTLKIISSMQSIRSVLMGTGEATTQSRNAQLQQWLTLTRSMKFCFELIGCENVMFARLDKLRSEAESTGDVSKLTTLGRYMWIMEIKRQAEKENSKGKTKLPVNKLLPLVHKSGRQGEDYSMNTLTQCYTMYNQCLYDDSVLDMRLDLESTAAMRRV